MPGSTDVKRKIKTEFSKTGPSKPAVKSRLNSVDSEVSSNLKHLYLHRRNEGGLSNKLAVDIFVQILVN